MNRNKRKLILIACSIALLLTVAVGGTVAYLIAQTSEVTNTFAPSEVKCAIGEKFQNNEKTNVYVTNTGDVDAYIRAMVIITWKDQANGKVYSQKPEEAHYDVSWGNGWKRNGDFYYWPDVVKVGEKTGNLIESIKPTGTRPEGLPDGYELNVEILAQAIQSTPTKAVKDSWSISVSNGKIQ